MGKYCGYKGIYIKEMIRKYRIDVGRGWAGIVGGLRGFVVFNIYRRVGFFRGIGIFGKIDRVLE